MEKEISELKERVASLENILNERLDYLSEEISFNLETTQEFIERCLVQDPKSTIALLSMTDALCQYSELFRSGTKIHRSHVRRLLDHHGIKAKEIGGNWVYQGYQTKEPMDIFLTSDEEDSQSDED